MTRSGFSLLVERCERECDQLCATQSSGWANAWMSAPSVYAIAAKTAADVSAAVDFAREHRLRLVVKRGGHSYLGTSNAPDSLLISTRGMDEIVLHDGFVPQRCSTPPQRCKNLAHGLFSLSMNCFAHPYRRRLLGCSRVRSEAG